MPVRVLRIDDRSRRRAARARGSSFSRGPSPCSPARASRRNPPRRASPAGSRPRSASRGSRTLSSPSKDRHVMRDRRHSCSPQLIILVHEISECRLQIADSSQPDDPESRVVNLVPPVDRNRQRGQVLDGPRARQRPDIDGPQPGQQRHQRGRLGSRRVGIAADELVAVERFEPGAEQMGGQRFERARQPDGGRKQRPDVLGRRSLRDVEPSPFSRPRR